MYEDLIRSAQKLLDLGIGDTGRLVYIINTLQHGKKFYLSDQKYLDNLISKYKDSQKKRIVITSMKPVDSGITSKQDLGTSNQILETPPIHVEYVKTAMDELRNELKNINEKLGKIDTKIETVIETKIETQLETKIERKSVKNEIKDESVGGEKHIGRKVFFAFTVFIGWHLAANNVIYNIFSDVPSNLTMYFLPLYTLIGYVGVSEYVLVFILVIMLIGWVIIGLVNLKKSKARKTSQEFF